MNIKNAVEVFGENLTRVSKLDNRHGSLKRKAAQYLGKSAGEKLSRTDLKRLRAKANKIKKSTKKSERRGVQLARQVSWYNNLQGSYK